MRNNLLMSYIFRTFALTFHDQFAKRGRKLIAAQVVDIVFNKK